MTVARTHIRRKFESRRRATNRLIVQEYKETHPCTVCGESDPCCLDLHHREDKITAISTLMSKGRSVGRLMAEIAKCEVLCANCHRKHHAANKQERIRGINAAFPIHKPQEAFDWNN